MKTACCVVLLSLLILVGSCEGSIEGLNVTRIVAIFVCVVFFVTGLILLKITHRVFKNVQDNSKFHIQLALAIILALTVDSVVYIIEWSVKGTLNKVNCIVISALDHYFYIAAFMWIGADGVLLCQKVVCDFKKTTTLHLFIVSFVCWAAPLLPVIVILSVNSQSNTSTIPTVPPFCYFTTNSLLYPWLTYGLILVILAVNIVIFTCSSAVIVKHKCQVRQLKRKKADRETQQDVLMLVKRACKRNCGLLGIICLLTIPIIVLYGRTAIPSTLPLNLFTLISICILQLYVALQGLILLLLISNSDPINQCLKLICDCIKKKRQASSRQELREHAVNRMNKTSKMAQGISKGQHQDENMEEFST